MKCNDIVLFGVWLLLISFAHNNASAKMPCGTLQEKQSMNVRAVQSQLMVAALSCELRRDYNKFIKNYQKEINASASNLKNYFVRNYTKNAEKQLNNFITGLANEASNISLEENSATFCARAGQVFAELEVRKHPKLADYAAENGFGGGSVVQECKK